MILILTLIHEIYKVVFFLAISDGNCLFKVAVMHIVSSSVQNGVVFPQSDKELQLELSAHNLPHDKEIDRMTVLHNVEGFALVMLCRDRKSVV